MTVKKLGGTKSAMVVPRPPARVPRACRSCKQGGAKGW
jgi:hypothetical protein